MPHTRTVGEILDFGEPKEFKEHPLLLTTDGVGIEIELENARGPLTDHYLKYWQRVHDGSLRNNGIELVLRGPIGGEKVALALQEVQDIIPRKKAERPVLNERTGLHVHVDVRDLKPKQLKSFLLLAIMFEEIFMRKTGNRANNIFCCGFKTSDAQLEFVSNIGGMKTTNVNHIFNNVRKYASVNLYSIAERGSVEFRYHKGTYDKDEILQWVNTLLSLKKYSRLPSTDADNLTGKFSADGGPELFIEVLGAELANKYYDESSEKLLVSGMRLAQDALLMHRMRNMQNTIHRKYRNKEDDINPLAKKYRAAYNDRPEETEETVEGGGYAVERALNAIHQARQERVDAQMFELNVEAPRVHMEELPMEDEEVEFDLNEEEEF